MHFKVVKKNHHQRRVRFNREASLVSSLGLWKKPFKAMGGDRSGTRLVKKRRRRLIWRPQSTNREAKKVFQQTFFFLEPPTRFCGGMWNGWVSIFFFSALLLWNFLIFSPKCKLELCTNSAWRNPPVTFYLYTIRSLFASRTHYFPMPWEHLSLRMQKVALCQKVCAHEHCRACMCERSHPCIFIRRTPVTDKDGLISQLRDGTVLQQSPSCTAFTPLLYSRFLPIRQDELLSWRHKIAPYTCRICLVGRCRA